VEKHDVDVAEWIQLAPPVPSERDDRKRGRGATPIAKGGADRRVENVLEKDIDQVDAQGANLATASTVLVPQAETMLLDPEEFFVKRQGIDGPHRARRRQLALGMSQNFSEMTGSGHVGFSIFDWRFSNEPWRQVRRSIEIRNSKFENCQSSIA
jgi:hypothetical protein